MNDLTTVLLIGVFIGATWGFGIAIQIGYRFGYRGGKYDLECQIQRDRREFYQRIRNAQKRGNK